MSKPEFDQYAGQYERVLGETIPGYLNEDGYFAEYKIALMAARLNADRHGASVVPEHRSACASRRPHPNLPPEGEGATESLRDFRADRPLHVLDFGCGEGRSLPYLEQYFPEAVLYGYDLSSASLEIAFTRTPRAKLFSDWGSIANLRFDAIIAANVFHHIPVEQRQPALAQCRKVLAEGGQMFLFEHNPFNPATRWIFERCPFDADAQMLSLGTAQDLIRKAGFQSEQHGYALFFPRQLAFLRGLEPWLKHLPLGAQYYVQMAK